MKRVKLTICVAMALAVAALVPTHSTLARMTQQLSGSETLLIDAGHGGFDGGAESTAGVAEKDINLSIAQKLGTLAETDGWNIAYTRDADESLGKGEGTIRSRKTADLEARKGIIDRVDPMLTVSIHLNSYREDRTVHGPQVFYPQNGGTEQVIADSKALAEAVQRALNAGTENERVALAKTGMKIFRNPQTPIILVECGFLSNAEEAERLSSDAYQRELAAFIYEGIMEYTGFEHVDKMEIIVSKGEISGLK